MATISRTFSGGATYVAPYGQDSTAAFSGVWVIGDTYTVPCTSIQGDFTLGKGILAGASPTYGLSLNGRVYLAAGLNYIFSENNDPLLWEEQNPGAGFVGLLSQYGIQDAATSLAAYQGYLAVFLSQSIQIWNVNADPTQFFLKQTLPNIGTPFGFSVQSLGDWDVLFLAYTGVRSLRVRDSSLNAQVIDVGTPIDQTLQAALLGYTAGTNAAPCSIVDPESNRYWLFLQSGSGATLDNTIYVLSYFPTEHIAAWGTYKPTYQSGQSQLEFAPVKMISYQGRVYIRGTDKATGVDYLFLYGGSTNNVYDNCKATVETPWLVAKMKLSSQELYAYGIDVAVNGSWDIFVGMDFRDGTLSKVATGTKATYDNGLVPFAAQGTHFKMRATSVDGVQAQVPFAPTVSALALMFDFGTAP